ncbi:AMP-binding protein [Epidermidibacterium keratini]|uniref:AMP-binding protein n=1 Tax=Epidermidibacterium keratini TaxID=1891644 RepID=A0A7L4YMX8_9ACTN|nr:AMP-binding protein [Epidermidibacterium keratini]QHC00641.1 AMP-binding protein [Epidermidibacterium keratini]
MYLTAGLHKSLQLAPDATMLIDGEVRRSFGEVADRVARLAGALRSLGAQPGDRIGILSLNSAAYAEIVLACAWGGFVFAPINARWSVPEMQFQVDDAQIAICFTDNACAAAASRLTGLRQLVSTAAELDSLIASGEPIEDQRMGWDELAGLLYTGGTTGRAKGVMINARGILTSTYGSLASAGQPLVAERFLHISPFYHLAALGSLLLQVQLGSTHILLPAFEIDAFLDTVSHEEVSATTLVPTMMHLVFTEALASGRSLPTLRRIGYGASPISEATLRLTMQAVPGVLLAQRYGMTELGPVATVLAPHDHDLERPDRLRSAGRAALHNEVRVVDPSDRPLPTGEVGEVVVRGANVMMGYWNLPEQTADTLRGGWMHTGDLGYFDDEGFLYVVDRVKDMIVTGGENVYSTEVEKALAAHPAVDQVAVVGVPDDDWGERVHAYVVLAGGESVDASALREFTGKQIAHYKVPKTIDFIDEMPLSPVGKILKRELRQRVSSNAVVEQRRPRGA